jgi:hypothetical protein
MDWMSTLWRLMLYNQEHHSEYLHGLDACGYNIVCYMEHHGRHLHGPDSYGYEVLWYAIRNIKNDTYVDRTCTVNTSCTMQWANNMVDIYLDWMRTAITSCDIQWRPWRRTFIWNGRVHRLLLVQLGTSQRTVPWIGCVRLSVLNQINALWTCNDDVKDRLRELVQLCLIKKNGQRIYKYLELGRYRSYL